MNNQLFSEPKNPATFGMLNIVWDSLRILDNAEDF